MFNLLVVVSLVTVKAHLLTLYWLCSVGVRRIKLARQRNTRSWLLVIDS